MRKILSFEMTIAEWIGTAILVGIPYLVVGVIWSATHTATSAACPASTARCRSSDPS